MKFPYVQIGDSLMPVIPVTLTKGEHSIAVEALVDSGASKCIFDAQFAKKLGINDVEAGRRELFYGIAGDPVIGYFHKVTLEIGGNPFPEVDIAFSFEIPDDAVNILGQQGFFELCPIKFTYAKKEIDVMMGGLSR